MKITVSEDANEPTEKKPPSQTKKSAATTITTRHDRRKHVALVRRYARLAMIALVAGAVLVILFMALRPRTMQSINHSGYQVVYLMNGRAYFGKLQNTSGDYLVIRSPYAEQTISAPSDAANTTPQTKLLKVSDQIYGPDDSIALRADQVAFWQNLRDNSKVVQALKADQ